MEDGLAGLPVLMEALLLFLLCLAANPAAAYNVVGFSPGLLAATKQLSRTRNAVCPSVHQISLKLCSGTNRCLSVPDRAR